MLEHEKWEKNVANKSINNSIENKKISFTKRIAKHVAGNIANISRE